MEQAPTPPASVERVPRFAPPDILWYFGVLFAAGAGNALILQTSTAQRGLWILLVGLALIAVFGALATAHLVSGRRVPGGVVAAAAVWLVPATEVGFERLVGVHPKLGGPVEHAAFTLVPYVGTSVGGGFHGAYFSIAMGAVVVGLAVYWLVRFPFILLPVVFWLAVAVQLFIPAVVTRPGPGDYVAAALILGVAFFVAGLLLDARDHRAEAFWWYVLGLFQVAVGFGYYIGAQHHRWVWLVLLVAAAVVLLASAPLGRATWAAYSVVGLTASLAHYADTVTASWRTPVLLTAIGLGLVLLGIALEAAGGAFVARLTQPWRPRPR